MSTLRLHLVLPYPLHDTDSVSRIALLDLRGAAVASTTLLSVACNTYDSSLLRYSDAATADTNLDVASEAPFDAGTDSLADAAPEDVAVDVTDSGEPDTEIDAGDGAPEGDATQEEPFPCTAVNLDCDNDASNGCEAFIETDGTHCGACGHDCLGGTCAAGACQPFALATGQTSPAGLVVDPGTSGRVYWTNRVADGTLASVDKTGGSVVVLASGQELPGGLAMNATHLFWSNASTGPNGTIMSVPKTGAPDAGAPTLLASEQIIPLAVAVLGSRVYWTNAVNNVGVVSAVDAQGGVVEVIADNQDFPTGIAADTTGVYWVNHDGGQLMALDFLTVPAQIRVLASDLVQPAGLTLDTTNVYWSELAGNIRKKSKLDGSTSVLLADQQGLPLSVAVDGIHVYWTDNAKGVIARTSTAGGTVETVASGQNGPMYVAVDNLSVYWTNGGDGTIMRKAK
jgi:hypothetical protein